MGGNYSKPGMTIKGVKNDLTTTEEGYVLDARQGIMLMNTYNRIARFGDSDTVILYLRCPRYIYNNWFRFALPIGLNDINTENESSVYFEMVELSVITGSNSHQTIDCITKVNNIDPVYFNIGKDFTEFSILYTFGNIVSDKDIVMKFNIHAS